MSVFRTVRRHRLVVGSAVALLSVAGATTASTASAAPAPLDRWASAISARDTAPATWLASGDSITEGQGATALGKRWINVTLAGVRTAFPTAGASGGVGYLPGWDYLYAPSRWTPYSSRSGSVQNVETPTSFGELTAKLGRNASQSYSVTGTSADVLYDSASGGGTLAWSVDGGRATNVSTNGAVSPAHVVHVPFARAGTHTVKVASTTGTVYLEGVRGYDGDETKGVRLVADAHAGYTSSAYAADRARRNQLVALAAPDLVTLEWGANDYLSATGTPAQLTANLTGEVANLRTVLATTPPSVVVVVSYPLGTGKNRLGYTWADYADAIRAVAANDPSVGVLDFTGAPITGANLDGDKIHPTDAGHAALAAIATGYLTGA